MTKDSYICNYINNNPNTWEYDFEKFNIKHSSELPYMIFNYAVNADFHNPIVQEARGIIINMTTLNVACWPFRKFGNYTEDYIDNIDWSTATLQEKIDGSIVKRWYDHANETWRWSTNRCIGADNADVVGTYGLNFLDIIYRCSNEIAIIDNQNLNKNYTYIFELVSPDTTVVVEYPEPHLYHLGTRSNLTGTEYDIDIGIRKPLRWEVSSLYECVQKAALLNISDDEITDEGFVVVDKDYHRIKVKSPKYLEMHHKISNNVFSKKRIIEYLRSDYGDVNELCKRSPNNNYLFKYYDFKMFELKARAKRYCEYVDFLNVTLQGDTKQIALKIKNDELSAIGFQHLNKGMSYEEILNSMSLAKYIKYIPDYIEKEHGFVKSYGD